MQKATKYKPSTKKVYSISAKISKVSTLSCVICWKQSQNIIQMHNKMPLFLQIIILYIFSIDLVSLVVNVVL